MPTVYVPRQFTLRFNDGRELNFPAAGRYPVDDEVAKHPAMRRLLVTDDGPMRATSLSAAPVAPGIATMAQPEPVRGPQQEQAAGSGPAAAVEIPDDIEDEHHMKRIALAQKLPGGEGVTTDEQARQVIAAERARRAAESS